MNKNQVMIVLVVLCLLGTVWGSVKDKQSKNLIKQVDALSTELSEVKKTSSPEAVTDREELRKSQKELLTDAATLKGTIKGQQDEIVSLQEKLVSNDAAKEIEGQLNGCQEELGAMQENDVALKAELDLRNHLLVEANAKISAVDQVKNQLANDLDATNQQAQEMAAVVEEYAVRINGLETALEKRTKTLVKNGEELDRTKLNMHKLLSKIAAQQDSLKILEKTRVALEKELAGKFLLIEELEHQLSAGESVKDVIEGAPVQQ